MSECLALGPFRHRRLAKRDVPRPGARQPGSLLMNSRVSRVKYNNFIDFFFLQMDNTSLLEFYIIFIMILSHLHDLSMPPNKKINKGEEPLPKTRLKKKTRRRRRR